MFIEKDPELSALITCRFLYEQGADTCKELKSPWRAGIAISHFQDSVELFLRVLCSKRSVLPNTNNFGFMKMLEALRDNLESFDHYLSLEELNKARVAFKHYGVLPAPEMANRFQYQTRDYLRHASEKYFELDFYAISRVSLIQNKEIRERLTQVVSILDQSEDILERADDEKARLTLAEAVFLCREIHPLPTIEAWQLNLGEEWLRDQSLSRVYEKLNKRLDLIKGSIVTNDWGISVSEISRLQRLLPAASTTSFNQPIKFGYTGKHRLETPISTKELEECFNSILQMTLNLESKYATWDTNLT